LVCIHDVTELRHKERELEGILSPQQWQKFEAARPEMRKEFEERIEEGAGRK
jgi:hypothetical protein